MTKPMHQPTILIADDNTAMLSALQMRLEAEGFKVATAEDAYSALDRATHLSPDLIILDVNMPAGNGFSVQKRMRKVEELAAIPVIYLTGSSGDTIDQSAAAMGAFAVVHKPFQTVDLLATIHEALAQSGEPAAS